MNSQAADVSRFHALDSLRAAMMFLGIYMHVVVAYSPIGGWAFKPPELTTTLDWSLVLIHVFRMPVFYVMAGFFAALLWERYGFRRAAKNRFWRIVVPFVAGWMIIYPLMMFLTAFSGKGLPWALEFILSGRFLAHPHPLHLWFLEYLIVLYLLAVAVVVGIRVLVPVNVQHLQMRFFRSIMQSIWAPFPFAVLSFLALLPMKHAGLEDPPSFVPATHIVVAYAIPFAFGWLLFANTDLLDTLRRRAWLYAVIGAVMGIVYLVLIYSVVDRGMPFYVTRAAHALCMKDVPLPPLAKIPLVLVATIAVLLPFYRYGVRPTFVGAVLNGRRYPGAFTPSVAAAY